MSRSTYVFRDGKMVLKDESEPLQDIVHYIRDEMDPTLHMASGKMFTSKHKFRAETKAYGCIEVGDQANFGRRREPIRLTKRERVEHIKHAIHQLKNGDR